MHQYECTISLNGVVMRTIVVTQTMQDARRLIEAQFPTGHLIGIRQIS